MITVEFVIFLFFRLYTTVYYQLVIPSVRRGPIRMENKELLLVAKTGGLIFFFFPRVSVRIHEKL